MSFKAGQIVLVDWRDALPREPSKKRPGIVVEDSELFDAAYPNLILVPLAEDPHLAIEDLSVRIAPTPEAVPNLVTRSLIMSLRPPSSASHRPVRTSPMPSSRPSAN